MMASGQQIPPSRYSFGAIAFFALLALAPPIQASTGSSSSCVQITNIALSSPCVPGANKATSTFEFSVEGTTTDATTAVAQVENGVSGVEGTTSIAARAGGDVVSCPATGAFITVGFATPVTSVAYPGKTSQSGNNVATFYANILGSNPTEFKVVLDATDIAAGTNLVTYVSYSDNQGNDPDMSGLTTFSASGLECDGYVTNDTATDYSRKLHEGHEEYDCDVCENLSDAEVEALASYDNGGKQVICDPTCLDGVSDPTHCNYFGLGQICRGCGDCSSCTPCPVTPAPTETLVSTPAPVVASTPSPTMTTTPEPTGTPVMPAPTPAPVVASTPAPISTTTSTDESDDDDSSEFDCEVCAELSDAEVEVLASYDNGGKQIICDPTCLDGVSDPAHCNYFGLGQICRGCGDCSSCTPCPVTPAPTKTPVSTPAPVVASTPSPTMATTPEPTETPVMPAPTPAHVVASTPAPISTTTSTDESDDDDSSEFDCEVCAELSDAEVEALAMYDNGGKTIVCDPTCLDGVSDPIHCNYFGLGQICRGCGDCSTCTPCP